MLGGQIERSLLAWRASTSCGPLNANQVAFAALGGTSWLAPTNQAEVLLKVLSDEPLPLRAVQPELPADLETIVMKCLNREPAQRYSSARALAEDLQRYLNGEPIAGKRASLLYRLRRRAQKHQAAVAVGCLALIGLSVVGAYGIQARLQVRRERVQAEARAKLSQELGQSVKDMEWFMRSVHELPVHDTSYAQAILQARIQRLKSIGHGLGSAGDGLVQYALGNAYVALQDFDRAYEHLSDAQHKGNDTPELRAALGRVLGEQYKTKIEEALRIGDVSFVKAQKKELRAKYIQPAVALLRSSQGAELGSPLLLAGLIALYSEQYDEALSQSEAAAKQSPWRYEAKQLAGDVYFARGIDLRSETKFDEAKQSFERAVEKYKEAAESGRSDVILYEAIAESYLQWGDIATNLQSRFAEVTLLEQANASCQKALLIAPDRPSCYSKSARAYALIISANMFQDRPSGSYFEKLKEIAAKGLVLNPNDYDLYDSIGIAYMDTALGSSTDNEEDLPNMMKNLDISIGYIQRSLKIFPNSPRAHTNLALLYLNKSLNVVVHAIPGEKPEYELAISHQKAASVIDPNYAPARDGLFNTYFYLIQSLAGSGRDPSAAYRELKKESDAFLAMHLGDDLPIWSIAIGYHQYARYVLLAGNYADLPDVVERQKALSAYAERILSPGHGVAAFVRLHQAEDEARLLVFQGQDPSPALAMGRAAVAGCDTLWFALRSYCHSVASSLALLSADQAALRGQPVLPHIQQAVADARQAITLLPREVDSREQLARALLRLAEAQMSSPAAVDEGLKLCTSVLQANAGWTEGHALRGRFYLLKMKTAGTAKERLALARQAQDDFALAVQRNPLLARPYQRYIAQANELLAKLSSN